VATVVVRVVPVAAVRVCVRVCVCVWTGPVVRTVRVMVVRGSAAVTVVGRTPKQEQALAYRADAAQEAA